MNETKGSAEPRDSPYFGLDYYQEKFGAWFFGREPEGGKIITNLRAARLTLLHAESGVGKSSLLRAGVAWRMRRLADDTLARRGTARFVPIVFSSWKDDPVLELTGAIRTAIRPYLAGRPEPELPTDRLDAAIGAASAAVNASLLIMLDQFEEYFLYRSREPTPERFADELARCINRADLRANFLISIREDAYAGLGDLFKGRITNVYGNYLHVDYLDRASAEKAIREPLDIYNGQPDVSEHVKIQDELVEAVLDQVRAFDGDGDAAQGRAAAANGGGDRVATPLLQLVMETVWERERAEGSHELRLSTLQNLRGVRMIVDAHLGKALSALSGSERQTAIDMFDHLVTPSGENRGIGPRSGAQDWPQRDSGRQRPGQTRSRAHRQAHPGSAWTGPHAVPPLRDLPRRARAGDQSRDRSTRRAAPRAPAPALRRLDSGPSDRGVGDRGCVRLSMAQRDY